MPEISLFQQPLCDPIRTSTGQWISLKRNSKKCAADEEMGLAFDSVCLIRHKSR
jgi:hypothetical protein